VIRPPRADELERLRDIERAAGRVFADVGLPEVAADEPPPVAVLERYRLGGWAWVATAPGEADGGQADGAGAPGGDGGPSAGDDLAVGYVIVDVLDEPGPGHGSGRSAHIEQVSVDPRFAGRRVGARLVDHVAAEARRRGLDAVTLTTFRDVPWNAPYYEGCGFRTLAEDELGPGLRRVRAEEAAHGLDPALRVCMRREI
jgi:ribosomal protein S18 acetylase RimI-like enzyme